MADNVIDRREILKVAAVIGGAGAIGFTVWRLSPQVSEESGCHPDLHSTAVCYEPKVLNAKQFGLLDTLTDLIIPEDETAGARSAGVAEFVDFYSSRDNALTAKLHDALAWFDAEAKRRKSSSFVGLDQKDQIAILDVVSAPEKVDGASHFSLLRQLTVLAFYSSEVGWQELSNPFLRSAYKYEELPGYPYIENMNSDEQATGKVRQ